MALTSEQFRKAREAGYTLEQIVQFEKMRTKEEPARRETLIPEPISGLGRTIESVTQRLPESIRQPSQQALQTARETFMGGVLPAVVPGGRITVEQPELAARTALGVLKPIPSAVGFAGRKLAETERGREIISKAQERLATMPPTTIPGRIQTAMARGMTPEEYQKFGAGIAETAGFLGTEMAGVRMPVLKQNIAQLGQTLTRFHLFKNPNFVLQQSVKINQITNDLERESGKAVRDLFAGDIGNKSVDVDKATNTLKKLPANVLNTLSNPQKTTLFDIEFEADGSLRPTARNIWKVRRFLDNFLSSKDFIDATKMEKQTILQARRGLAGVLRDVDKNIAPIMDKFSKVTNAADKIRTVTMTKGAPVANKLRILVSSKGEPGLRKFFDDIASLRPEVRDIMNDVIKFNRGQLLKKGAAAIAGIEVGRRLLRRGISPIISGETE